MKNILKLLFFVILNLVVFSGNSVFAFGEPRFETLEPEILENGIVRFQGQFNSRGAVYADDVPETWFEFGENINNLDFRSQRRERPQGRYIVSQGATRFQKGIQYYVRAVIRYDGGVQRGEIISFNPYKIAPVIFPSENIIQQPAIATNQTPLNFGPDQSNKNKGSNSQVSDPKINTTGSSIETLPAPSFNLLDFSQFRLPSSRNRSVDNNSESDIISNSDANSASGNSSEKGDENGSDIGDNNLESNNESSLSSSSFENSASNSNSSGEIIRERGRDTQVNSSNNQDRSNQSASVANSGARTTFPAYLALVTVFVMVIISVILFRVTHKKRKKLYRREHLSYKNPEPYNPNNGAYAQYNKNKKPE